VGTLAWLLARYRETTAWSELSLATRRQRENIFLHVLEAAGEKPFARINQAAIIAGRDRRAATPAQARNFLDAMRGLCRWAHTAKLIKTDPTAGVKNPPRKKGDGFISWTEENVAAYEAEWPIGTRQRVWLDVLLYTGLRRGDAVQLGRQHVRNGIATIRTEKSGGAIEVTLPILPVLAATLNAGSAR
jgi:integrase